MLSAIDFRDNPTRITAACSCMSDTNLTYFTNWVLTRHEIYRVIIRVTPVIRV
jgi:hypothetical protein